MNTNSLELYYSVDIVFIKSILAMIPLKLHLVELIIPLMHKLDDCEKERFVSTKLFEYDSY